MERSDGFPAISRTDARILVLGSLPGRRSIAAQEYYAHPRNAFWPIMQELFDIRGSYEERCERLCEHRIALWDVLLSSARPGSLDADIHTNTAKANDFVAFFAAHQQLRLVAFNGRKAQQLFHRFVDAYTIGTLVEFRSLPSTSPAYAAMSFSGKVAAWRQLAGFCQ